MSNDLRSSWHGNVLLCAPFYGWKHLHPQAEVGSALTLIEKAGKGSRVLKQKVFPQGGSHSAELINDLNQIGVFTQGRRKDGAPQDCFVIERDSWETAFSFQPSPNHEFTGHGFRLDDHTFATTEAPQDTTSGSRIVFREGSGGAIQSVLDLPGNVIHDAVKIDDLVYITTKGAYLDGELLGSGVAVIDLRSREYSFLPAKSGAACQHIAIAGGGKFFASTSHRALPARITEQEVLARWKGELVSRRERENPRNRADVFLPSDPLVGDVNSGLSVLSGIGGSNGHGVVYLDQLQLIAFTTEIDDSLVFYSLLENRVVKRLVGPQIGVYHPTAICQTECKNFLLVAGRYAHIAAIRLPELEAAPEESIAIDTHDLSHFKILTA
jgi:hypothetical protein